MNPFEMVVAIIIVVTIGRVLQARYTARSDRTDGPAETAETMRMRDEIRSLKERVAVLERVITDHNQSMRLDEEIEKLRDKNRV